MIAWLTAWALGGLGFLTSVGAFIAQAAVDVSSVGAGTDITFWEAVIAQHGPTVAMLVGGLAYLSKLLSREQTARDAATADLVSTLKSERAAVVKLETAVTGLGTKLESAVSDLTGQLAGLRGESDTLRRGHEDLRSQVSGHAARLDDHERRLAAHESADRMSVQGEGKHARDQVTRPRH